MKRGPHLLGRPTGRRKPQPRIPGLVPAPLGNVEHHTLRSSPQLVRQLRILLTNPLHKGRKLPHDFASPDVHILRFHERFLSVGLALTPCGPIQQKGQARTKKDSASASASVSGSASVRASVSVRASASVSASVSDSASASASASVSASASASVRASVSASARLALARGRFFGALLHLDESGDRLGVGAAARGTCRVGLFEADSDGMMAVRSGELCSPSVLTVLLRPGPFNCVDRLLAHTPP